MSSTKFPKITLKGFKYYAGMSQETNCFVATVCFDGVPVMTAENQGHGGSTNLQLLKDQKIGDFQRHYKTLEEIHDSDKVKYPYDFEKAEEIIDNLVYREIQKKSLVAKMKKKTVFTATDAKGLFTINRPYVPGMNIKNVGVILNSLDIESAMDIYMSQG